MSGEKRILTEWLNRESGFFYTVNRTLHEGRTKFQKIELVETDELGNVLLLDDITQVAEKNDWQYHEPMVHIPLLTHEAPERVLVIGGGDGGILREVIRHRTVSRIDVAELDGEVIEFSRRYLPALGGGAFDDPRVTVSVVDGREFVASHPAQYDVVIMDMTDPSGPSRYLYTREFFALVRESLRDERGLFTMHSESAVTRPATFARIRATLQGEFRHVSTAHAFVQMYATLWSFSSSSMSSDPTALSAQEIDRRISDRGLVDLRMIDGATWCAMHVVPPYIRRLDHGDVPTITDAQPDFPDEIR